MSLIEGFERQLYQLVKPRENIEQELVVMQKRVEALRKECVVHVEETKASIAERVSVARGKADAALGSVKEGMTELGSAFACERQQKEADFAAEQISLKQKAQALQDALLREKKVTEQKYAELMRQAWW